MRQQVPVTLSPAGRQGRNPCDFLSASRTQYLANPHMKTLQDYRVHLKHRDGHFEKVPYFSLPANDLNDVIAPSCYACFDYANAAADVVVGYMGVPSLGVDMTQHLQVSW